jgi:hypothetical protein
MADSELFQEWLNKAEEDFGFAASVIQQSPYFAQICFHFHQAAEKYLKACIQRCLVPKLMHRENHTPTSYSTTSKSSISMAAFMSLKCSSRVKI